MFASNEIFGIIGPGQQPARPRSSVCSTGWMSSSQGMHVHRRRSSLRTVATSATVKQPLRAASAGSVWSFRCPSDCRSVDLRQRRARAASLRGPEPQERAGRDRRTVPHARRTLGRGEGPARQSLGSSAFGRPAAAPDDRSCALAGSRPAAPRRVLDRSRSGHHDADRRRAQGAASQRDHDRAGDQPRATGPSTGRPDRVLPHAASASRCGDTERPLRPADDQGLSGPSSTWRGVLDELDPDVDRRHRRPTGDRGARHEPLVRRRSRRSSMSTSTIKEGIITSLIGPSGCGKSTFLRCAASIGSTSGSGTSVRPGTIRVLGSRHLRRTGVELVQVRKQDRDGLPAPEPAADLDPGQRHCSGYEICTASRHVERPGDEQDAGRRGCAPAGAPLGPA